MLPESDGRLGDSSEDDLLQSTVQRLSLLHSKCYEKLQKHLLRALAATPAGKKWTEAQLVNNVWGIRGADILHKYSKCSCGGTLEKAEEESKVSSGGKNKGNIAKGTTDPGVDCFDQ